MQAAVAEPLSAEGSLQLGDDGRYHCRGTIINSRCRSPVPTATGHTAELEFPLRPPLTYQARLTSDYDR